MLDPLVSVDDLKTYIQRPVSPSAAALAVTSASAAVRAHCGWDITRDEEAVLKAAGNNSRILSLPTLHLIAVDKVTIDGATVTDWKFSARGQLYRTGGIWPDFADIAAECIHGLDPIPDVIRVVALGFATRQVGNPERFKTAAVGSVSRTYDLTDLDVNLLFPYRIFPTS